MERRPCLYFCDGINIPGYFHRWATEKKKEEVTFAIFERIDGYIEKVYDIERIHFVNLNKTEGRKAFRMYTDAYNKYVEDWKKKLAEIGAAHEVKEKDND